MNRKAGMGERKTIALIAHKLGLDVTRLKSGPFGGDQQIGARIAEGTVDFMIFLCVTAD